MTGGFVPGAMSPGFAFGDIEPEDSWDRGDPVPELLANLFRRLALLNLIRIGDVGDDIGEQIDEVAHLIAHASLRDDLTERDRRRLHDLIDDADYIRTRIAD